MTNNQNSEPSSGAERKKLTIHNMSDEQDRKGIARAVARLLGECCDTCVFYTPLDEQCLSECGRLYSDGASPALATELSKRDPVDWCERFVRVKRL